jgi:hypothetical protein
MRRVARFIALAPARFMALAPAWRAALVIGALVGVGLAWYLGSPLFIRTTLNEALPTITPGPAGAAPTAAATGAATPAAAAGPVILAQGELQFVDNLHNGKGPVRIVRIGDQRILRFENVAITNAPDIHVYMSPETGGKWAESTSLYLGALKATNGSFNYPIPAGTNLAQYKSVVVWCRAFSTLITWADLRPA